MVSKFKKYKKNRIKQQLEFGIVFSNLNNNYFFEH